MLAGFLQVGVLQYHRQSCLSPVLRHQIRYSHQVLSCAPLPALNPILDSFSTHIGHLLLDDLERLVLLSLICFWLLLLVLSLQVVDVLLHGHPWHNLPRRLCLSSLGWEVPLDEHALVALPGTGNVGLGKQLFNPIICHHHRSGCQLPLLLYGGSLLTDILHELFHI